MELTFLEKKVIYYLIECPTQEEAAKQCCICYATFKNVLRGLREKFQSHNNLQLVLKINSQKATPAQAA